MNLFSIWIVPSSDIKKQLSEIVGDLSVKYQAPNFEPHMTLLGDVSLDKETMLQKSHLLVSQLKPFSASLGEISFSTTYFQSVFVHIKSNAALMNANLKAKEVFQVPNTIFMPHMSLLYGDHPMEEREKIASQITILGNLSFNVEKIIVVPSTKDPSEWKYLAEIPLNK